MNKFLNFWLDLIFPTQCVVCQKKTLKSSRFAIICDACFKAIEIRNGFTCPNCKNRLPEGKNTCHPEEKFVLAAAADYAAPAVQKLIYALKYQTLKTAAAPLGEILKIYLEKIDLPIQSEIVIPIPLFKTRERKRGFNQSQLIAENIFPEKEIIGDVLSRIKNTKPQIEAKDFKARIENITGSFQIKDNGKITGQNIVLIDDVYTSGATMKEAVKVLKKGGAGKIIALVIAKA